MCLFIVQRVNVGVDSEDKVKRKSTESPPPVIERKNNPYIVNIFFNEILFNVLFSFMLVFTR